MASKKQPVLMGFQDSGNGFFLLIWENPDPEEGRLLSGIRQFFTTTIRPPKHWPNKKYPISTPIQDSTRRRNFMIGQAHRVVQNMIMSGVTSGKILHDTVDEMLVAIQNYERRQGLKPADVSALMRLGNKG